jgi:hypothetical protein
VRIPTLNKSLVNTIATTVITRKHNKQEFKRISTVIALQWGYCDASQLD